MASPIRLTFGRCGSSAGAVTLDQMPEVTVDTGSGISATKSKRRSPNWPSPQRLPYLPGLDGVRAIAVTAVLLFHLPARIFPGGYLGVDTFFVLSGFLITTCCSKKSKATAPSASSSSTYGVRGDCYRRCWSFSPSLRCCA